jgi:hypothetical protein
MKPQPQLCSTGLESTSTNPKDPILLGLATQVTCPTFKALVVASAKAGFHQQDAALLVNRRVDIAQASPAMSTIIIGVLPDYWEACCMVCCLHPRATKDDVARARRQLCCTQPYGVSITGEVVGKMQCLICRQ